MIKFIYTHSEDMYTWFSLFPFIIIYIAIPKIYKIHNTKEDTVILLLKALDQNKAISRL